MSLQQLASAGARGALALACTIYLTFPAGVFAAGKDDLIRDDNAGIHKKLIIAADVAVYDKPDGSTNETLKPFEIFFQLWPSEDAKASNTETQGAWVRIGNAKGDERGWIKNDKVKDPQTNKEQEPFIPWLTRFMLDPRTPENPQSPTFTIEKINGQAAQVTFTGKGAGQKQAIAPILAEVAEGEKYKVAFLLGKAQQAAGTASVVQEQVAAKDLSIDLVFVIDTTASMTPLIDATKDVVKQCVDALKQSNPELRNSTRFGLVVYQDATPGLKPFEIVCPLADANTFEQKLKTVVAASQGSEEIPEDVLAGLTAAIGSGMGWNPTAMKHVMLLGDASAHVKGAKNTTGSTVEAVIAASQKQSGGELVNNIGSITFNAVRAKQQGIDPAEDQLCKEQFQLIASNAGRFQGFFADIDPNNSADKAKTVKEMVDFYRVALTGLSGAKSGNVAAVAAAANTGASAIAEQCYQIVNALGISDIPPVAQGEASDRDQNGNLVATKKVFISKAEIKRLASVLDFLYQSMKASNDAGERSDVAIVMNTLQTAVTMAASGEKGTQFGKDVSLKQVISQLPLKSDALEITIQELAQLPDDAFEEWLTKLESTRTTAKEISEISDDQWLTLSEGTDRADDLMFRSVRLEELP
jgi:hypothetical protein